MGLRLAASGPCSDRAGARGPSPTVRPGHGGCSRGNATTGRRPAGKWPPSMKPQPEDAANTIRGFLRRSGGMLVPTWVPCFSSLLRLSLTSVGLCNSPPHLSQLLQAHRHRISFGLGLITLPSSMLEVAVKTSQPEGGAESMTNDPATSTHAHSGVTKAPRSADVPLHISS
jgi:hypothetical protein